MLGIGQGRHFKCSPIIKINVFIFCREQCRFFQQILDRIDMNNAAFIYLKASFGWLGLQLVRVMADFTEVYDAF